MNESYAKLHVNKLAVAQKQLRAAVRMFFAGEDELAIHTVASAAYTVLSDLKAERGQDEVGDYHLTAIFYAVRDYRRGTLPTYLSEDPETMKWISVLAEQLPIDASTNIKDITATVSSDVAKKFWQKRNKVANFLKHADRDPQSHVALDDVDNLQLLMQALSAYIDLKSDDLGAEGLVFWLYFSVTSGIKEGLPQKFQEIAAKLEAMGLIERLKLCSTLVREMNETS